jgi:hypothetical protein
MDSKELAKKVIVDLQKAPQKFEGLKNEVEKLLHEIILDNAEEILNLKTEDDFFDFMAEVIDVFVVLPQPFESLDGTLIRYLLKKMLDPILDKYAGKNWFEKLKNFIGINKK